MELPSPHPAADRGSGGGGEIGALGPCAGPEPACARFAVRTGKMPQVPVPLTLTRRLEPRHTSWTCHHGGVSFLVHVGGPPLLGVGGSPRGRSFVRQLPHGACCLRAAIFRPVRYRQVNSTWIAGARTFRCVRKGKASRTPQKMSGDACSGAVVCGGDDSSPAMAEATTSPRSVGVLVDTRPAARTCFRFARRAVRCTERCLIQSCQRITLHTSAKASNTAPSADAPAPLPTTSQDVNPLMPFQNSNPTATAPSASAGAPSVNDLRAVRLKTAA